MYATHLIPLVLFMMMIADCLTFQSSSDGIDSHFLFTYQSASLQQSDFYSPLLQPFQRFLHEVRLRSPPHHAIHKDLVNQLGLT